MQDHRHNSSNKKKTECFATQKKSQEILARFLYHKKNTSTVTQHHFQSVFFSDTRSDIASFPLFFFPSYSLSVCLYSMTSSSTETSNQEQTLGNDDSNTQATKDEGKISSSTLPTTAVLCDTTDSTGTSPASLQHRNSHDVSGTVFVGGISYKVDEEQLKECFSKYGTVVEVKIIKDKFNNYQSKG